MRKLDGLIELRRRGLPCPDWRVVRNASEIDFLEDQNAPLGWIIRSCLEEGGNELGLPWRAYAQKHEVPRVVEEFRGRLGGKGLFIVQPCWNSVVSGNLLLRGEDVVLEYAKGFDIMGGVTTPANLVLSRSSGKVLAVRGSHWLNEEDMAFLEEGVARLHGLDCLVEWSRADDGNRLFYDLRLLRDFGKV